MDREQPYSAREIDAKMLEIHQKLDLILAQTTRHNGRLTKLERIMLGMACVVGTLLLTRGSELVQLIKLIV